MNLKMAQQAMLVNCTAGNARQSLQWDPIHGGRVTVRSDTVITSVGRGGLGTPSSKHDHLSVIPIFRNFSLTRGYAAPIEKAPTLCPQSIVQPGSGQSIPYVLWYLAYSKVRTMPAQTYIVVACSSCSLLLLDLQCICFAGQW